MNHWRTNILLLVMLICNACSDSEPHLAGSGGMLILTEYVDSILPNPLAGVVEDRTESFCQNSPDDLINGQACYISELLSLA